MEQDEARKADRRPPLGAPVKIAFDAEILADMDARAARERMTRSAWVRRVLSNELYGL